MKTWLINAVYVLFTGTAAVATKAACCGSGCCPACPFC